MKDDKDDLKDKIQLWGFKIGRQEAEKRLCVAGISWSLASKLLNGTYTSNVSPVYRTLIIKEMEKK